MRNAALLAVLLLLAACGEAGKQERGLRYMPDMQDAPSFESQDAMIHLVPVPDAGGGSSVIRSEIPSMQTPVPGTVASGHGVIGELAWDGDLAKSLANPLVPDAAVLRLGRRKFDVYCAVCHGKDGDIANGLVAHMLTGVLPINTDAVAGYTDGQVYALITQGRNRMPSYGAQLLPDERWAVIHYLRALYAATTAKGEEKRHLEELDRLDDRFAPEPEPIPDYLRGQWPTLPSKEGHQ